MTPATESKPGRMVWIYLITAVLSLVGLADSIYLTIEHLTGQSLRCTIISGCSEVLSSPYSHIGSVPLAALGAIAYFTAFSLAIIAAFGYRLVVRALFGMVWVCFFEMLLRFFIV